MPGPRDARAFLTTAPGLRKVSWHLRIRDVAAQRERVSSIPREEGTHGASRWSQSTTGVCGPPVYAGIAGQEDRLAAGIRVRADGGVTALKQESLRSCEASGREGGRAA